MTIFKNRMLHILNLISIIYLISLDIDETFLNITIVKIKFKTIHLIKVLLLLSTTMIK